MSVILARPFHTTYRVALATSEVYDMLSQRTARENATRVEQARIAQQQANALQQQHEDTARQKRENAVWTAHRFLEDFVSRNFSRYAEHVKITCDATIDEVIEFGRQERSEGILSCKRLFRVPAVQDEIGFGLWRYLREISEPIDEVAAAERNTPQAAKTSDEASVTSFVQANSKGKKKSKEGDHSTTNSKSKGKNRTSASSTELTIAVPEPTYQPKDNSCLTRFLPASARRPRSQSFSQLERSTQTWPDSSGLPATEAQFSALASGLNNKPRAQSLPGLQPPTQWPSSSQPPTQPLRRCEACHSLLSFRWRPEGLSCAECGYISEPTCPEEPQEQEHQQEHQQEQQGEETTLTRPPMAKLKKAISGLGHRLTHRRGSREEQHELEDLTPKGAKASSKQHGATTKLDEPIRSRASLEGLSDARAGKRPIRPYSMNPIKTPDRLELPPKVVTAVQARRRSDPGPSIDKTTKAGGEAGPSTGKTTKSEPAFREKEARKKTRTKSADWTSCREARPSLETIYSEKSS